MIENKLKITELEEEIFSLGGTEALIKMGKIIEKINQKYPIEKIASNAIGREKSMYRELEKLYREYLK